MRSTNLLNLNSKFGLSSISDKFAKPISKIVWLVDVLNFKLAIFSFISCKDSL